MRDTVTCTHCGKHMHGKTLVISDGRNYLCEDCFLAQIDIFSASTIAKKMGYDVDEARNFDPPLSECVGAEW